MSRNIRLQKTISTIITVLEGFPEIVVASLYGSSLQERMRPSSDIDIGVASTKALTFEKWSEVRLELCRALKKEVDLVDLWQLEGRILLESICHGKIIVMKTSHVLVYLMKKIIYFSADFEPLTKNLVQKRLERYFHVT